LWPEALAAADRQRFVRLVHWWERMALARAARRDFSN